MHVERLPSIRVKNASIEMSPYLISCKGTFLTRNRHDYHAVPCIIGVKKSYAEIFEKQWRNCVSNTELIYTRNEKGHSILAKARVRSLSSVFRRDTERREIWR